MHDTKRSYRLKAILAILGLLALMVWTTRAESILLPQLMIVAAGIVAWVMRIKSSTVCISSFVLWSLAALLNNFESTATIATAFAVYGFITIMIGTLLLMREIAHPRVTTSSSHKLQQDQIEASRQSSYNRSS